MSDCCDEPRDALARALQVAGALARPIDTDILALFDRRSEPPEAGGDIDEPLAVAGPDRVAVSGVDRRLYCHRIVRLVVALGAVVKGVEDTRAATRRLVLLGQGARRTRKDKDEGPKPFLAISYTLRSSPARSFY